MEFEQQSSGGHIFEPSGVGAPVPNLSEFLRETITMPVRVGSDQVSDFDKVLLSENAALNMERSLHESKGSMKIARESSEIFRGKLVRDASKDLSSYKHSRNPCCAPGHRCPTDRRAGPQDRGS